MACVLLCVGVAAVAMILVLAAIHRVREKAAVSVRREQQMLTVVGTTKPGPEPDEGEHQSYSIIIDCDPKPELVLPSGPFLIENLENVVPGFLQSWELLQENQKQKLAIFTALAFSQKLSGLPQETVFRPLLKDNLAGTGLVLSFVTEFFKDYLVHNTLDDIISILKRGKMEDNLLEFFPSGKRSAETNQGLIPSAEYNEKNVFEVRFKEMETAFTAQIPEETEVCEAIETVKQRHKDAKLPDMDLIPILWDVLMDAIQWSQENQQQNPNAPLRQVVFTPPPGPDEGEHQSYSITIDSEPKPELVLPSGPFHIENLKNVVPRFLQSWELLEENQRQKLAIFTALAFSQKLSGLPHETVFQPLLKDNLAGTGIVLPFVTEFFKEYLVDNSFRDLISVLKHGKMEDNLLPSGKWSAEGFLKHFSKEGLIPFDQYNEKKIFEARLEEMETALTTHIPNETKISEAIEAVKQHLKYAKLPVSELIPILWDVLMDAIQWSEKNLQQNANVALRQVEMEKVVPSENEKLVLTAESDDLITTSEEEILKLEAEFSSEAIGKNLGTWNRSEMANCFSSTKKREAPEPSFSKQSEKLQEWERSLIDREQRLAIILNHIDSTRETLKRKEEDINFKLSNLNLKKMECDSVRKIIENNYKYIQPALMSELHDAEAKLAEASRKSSKIVNKRFQVLESQECSLRKERLCFKEEREAHKASLSIQRDELLQRERSLRKERLCFKEEREAHKASLSKQWDELLQQERSLQKERLCFKEKREAHKASLSKQWDELLQRERKLQVGEERLAKGEVVNQRDERRTEENRMCKQKKELEEKQKLMDAIEATLKRKEEEMNKREAELSLREKNLHDGIERERETLFYEEKDLEEKKKKFEEDKQRELSNIMDLARKEIENAMAQRVQFDTNTSGAEGRENDLAIKGKAPQNTDLSAGGKVERTRGWRRVERRPALGERLKLNETCRGECSTIGESVRVWKRGHHQLLSEHDEGQYDTGQQLQKRRGWRRVRRLGPGHANVESGHMNTESHGESALADQGTSSMRARKRKHDDNESLVAIQHKKWRTLNLVT